MKKVYKTAAKVALGAGAAYLLAGEIMYEGVINIKMNNFIRSKTNRFDNPEMDSFWANNEELKKSDEWFDSQHAGDTVLWSFRLRKNVFAKVYFAENKTHNYVLFLHGYTSTHKSMAVYPKHYLEMGFNAVCPHMIGHGSDSTCYCSMGYYDRYLALDWIDYILSIDKDAKIIIHGVSMGSATTMMTTGEDLPDNVVAAVADCGYTSAWEEYQAQIGPMFHLPDFPLLYAANTVSKLRGNFDFKEAAPIKAIVHSKTPTLFIHGEADTFVPYEMMVPLYEACGAPDKDMLSVPNATHAASAFFEPEMYWNKVREFIGKYIEL